jgi:hypothetical protein
MLKITIIADISVLKHVLKKAIIGKQDWTITYFSVQVNHNY